jgi:hypothetical protein
LRNGGHAKRLPRLHYVHIRRRGGYRQREWSQPRPTHSLQQPLEHPGDQNPYEIQFFDALLEQEYLRLHSELLPVPNATQSLRINQKLQISLDPYITLEYTANSRYPIASNATRPNQTEGRFGCVVERF